MRKIICTNEDGMEVVFDNKFNPFLLEACDGIYFVENNVVTSENTMTDGATYQGSTTRMRNIVLTLRDRVGSDHQENRSLLYNLFKPKSPGIFTYIENGRERMIEYYVESVSIDSIMRARQATVSLICPDPFFIGPSDLSVTMAGWKACWEFDHEFTEEGEEFDTRIDEKLKVIENTSAADNIGITIKIKASGPVTNPTIYHIELDEMIKIGTEGKPMELNMGDQIIITTGTNNKHVYLVRDGVKTEVNEYIDEESEFIQLIHGENTIGYSAEDGEQYMTVVVSYRYRYLGV